MPEFVDIATHFDDIDTYDAYTLNYLFRGQFSTFDESAPDGSIKKRRTMSVRPGTPMPVRRVLQMLGEQWIVGDGNADGFQNKLIRQAYWLKKVTDTAVVANPGSYLDGSATTTMMIHREYLKDTINLLTDSEYDALWDVSVAASETINKGVFFIIGSKVLRARTIHADLNGMTVATCDDLDDALVTVTATLTSVYDPITDTTTGSSVTFQGIMLEMYKLFDYKTAADAKNTAGDKTLIVSNSVPVKVGDYLTTLGSRWQVVTKTAELDATQLHIRRQ